MISNYFSTFSVKKTIFMHIFADDRRRLGIVRLKNVFSLLRLLPSIFIRIRLSRKFQQI